MKHKKILMFILISILFFSFAFSAYADIDSRNTEYENENLFWGEKVISKIFLGLGQGVEYILSKTGVSIDSVVYNDDSGLPEGTENKLAFSFDDDNVFGNVSLTIYELFRNIMLLFMLPILAALGIKVWLKPSLSSNLAWKDSFLSYVISFVLLFIMPTLLKAAHTLILIFVNGFKTSEGLTFINVLAENAESGRIIDAILFCGGVGLTAWLGIMYAYRNIRLVFLVMIFPVFTAILNSEKLRKGYENWFKEVVSALTINLVDAVLLLAISIVLLMDLGAFLSLVIASCIIPVRKQVRELLGLSSGGMSEFGGVMAMAGAASLAGATGRGLRKGAGQILEGRDDIRESKKYGNAAEKIRSSMSQSSSDSAHSIVPVSSMGSRSDSTEELLSGPTLDTSFAGVSSVAGPESVSTAGMSPNASHVYAQLKADKLRRQGRKKIRTAGLGMTGGALGATTAALFTSMQGFPAMTYGSRIGGEFGSTAGYLAGMGISELKREEFYNEEEKAEREAKSVDKPIQTKGEIQRFKSETEIGEATVIPEKNLSTGHINAFPQERALPKDVGTTEEGYFTFDNVNKDIDKYLDDNVKEEIKSQAYNNAVQQTGIDPKALQKQYEEEAQKLYNEDLQSIADKGEPITIEVKTNAFNNAKKQAGINLNIKEQASHFSQVAKINQKSIQLSSAYNKLQVSGYSPGLLNEYEKSIRDELKSILEKEVQDMNRQDDISVDDIL